MSEVLFLIVIALLFLPVLLISYFKTKRIQNIILLISIWYLFWCFISCTTICDYRIEYNYGRLLVVSNIYVLLFTALLMIKKNSPPNCKVFDKSSFCEVDDDNLLKGIRILVLIVNLYYLLSVFVRLFNGSLSLLNLRNAAYSTEEGSIFSSFSSTIYYVFIKGFVLFDITVELCSVMTKQHKKANVIVFLNMIVFCITTLNRIDLARCVIVFIVILFVSGISIRDAIRKNKYLRYTLLSLIIGVGALIVLRYISSNANSGLILSVVNTIFEDFSIPYVTFDYFLSKYMGGTRIIEASIIDILFGGPIKVFEPILNLFGVEVINYNGVLANYIDYGIDVGRGIILKTNAFYTMYFNFVNGGGILICYLVSLFFGILLAILYNNWTNKKNKRSFVLLVFFIHIILMGLLRWEMYAYWSWVTLIFIVIFLRRKRVKIVIRKENK